MRRSNVPLLLAILVEAMGYGAIFGLIADLQDKYHFSDLGLGLIASSAFPAALIGQLGLSRFADRGHTRKLLWLGLGTAAAGMVWFFFGTHLWEFVVARMLVGLGSGTFIPAARRIIISRNPDNPGQAISVAGAADIGGFLVGIPVAKGLEHFLHSPNTPFLWLAVLLAVVGPIATLAPEPAIHDEHAGGDEIRRVFRIPMARAGLLVGVAFAVIIGTFDAVAARFLKDLHGTDGELVLVMIALAVPLIVFMPVAGKLVDRFGPIRSGTTALVVAAPMIAAFGLTRHLGVIAVLGGLVAMANSVVYTAGQTAVAESTCTIGLTGAGQGAYEATYATGAMFCSFIAPLLYQRDNAFPMWLTMGCLGLAAAAAAHVAGRAVRSDEVTPDFRHGGDKNLKTSAG